MTHSKICAVSYQHSIDIGISNENKEDGYSNHSFDYYDDPEPCLTLLLDLQSEYYWNKLTYMIIFINAFDMII